MYIAREETSVPKIHNCVAIMKNINTQDGTNLVVSLTQSYIGYSGYRILCAGLCVVPLNKFMLRLFLKTYTGYKLRTGSILKFYF